MENGKVRILLADGQSLFRESLRIVLENEPDLEVVGEARDGLDALTQAETLRPDVVMLDATLANGDTIRTTSQITESLPGSRVLVLSADEDLSLLVEALEAGASGYLPKDCPLADLMDGARKVNRGEVLVPSHMLGGLLGRLIRRRRDQDESLRKLSLLTRREREILALLAEGSDNDAIAKVLVISPQTARTHVQNILTKLGVHSRLEAAAFVIQNGIHDDLVEV